MKSCSKCHEVKQLAEFGRDRSKKDGYCSRCSACALEAATAWYAKNKDRKQQRDRKRYEKLADSIRARTAKYYEKNKGRLLESQMAYYRANPSRYRAYSAAAKARRRRGTPPWVDHAAIARVYEEAKAVAELTGVPHHVDHIVPICGKTVSGLHVPWNLQILPAVENLKKSNRLPAGALLVGSKEK